jgi:hypothetical protein
MTYKRQSDMLRLAGIADDGPWTYVIGVRKEIAAELRRQSAEIETLRTGYEAARLEIESLRAAQPAAQPSHEHQRAIMEGERNASLNAYSRVVSITSAESRLYERAFTNGWCRCASHGQAPAQAAPAAVAGPSEAVAYLDIGTGGYLDLGTDLADEALSRLPKGRHALVIAGTYGIDGYTAAPTTQPSPAVQGDALDAALLDWLNENIFYREMGEWDAKYGHGDGYNMWVLFAPKGVQGSARTIISAARAAQEGR